MLSLNSILKLSLLLILTASTVKCKEEFIIAYAPSSVVFKTMQPISTSSIGNLFSSILGYTTKDYEPNLVPVNPLKRPDAIVNFVFEGLASNTLLNSEGDHFALLNQGDLVDQYYILEKRTEKRYAGKKPTLLRMTASDDLYNERAQHPNLLQNLNPDKNVRLSLALKDENLFELTNEGFFNQSSKIDQRFFIEIETLNNLRDLIFRAGEINQDGIPDIYWFKFSSLSELSELYGSSSKQVKKAIDLFNKAIKQFEDMARKVYREQVLITVTTIAQESIVIKHKRAAEGVLDKIDSIVGGDGTDPITHDANVATEWSEDFHVAFMMILFVSILFILAVFGISLGMWNLDPGKDSLIYRMTGQRLKKD